VSNGNEVPDYHRKAPNAERFWPDITEAQWGFSGCLLLSNILFSMLLWICVQFYKNLKFSLL